MSIYRETQVAHAPRTALAIEFASGFPGRRTPKMPLLSISKLNAIGLQAEAFDEDRKGLQAHPTA